MRIPSARMPINCGETKVITYRIPTWVVWSFIWDAILLTECIESMHQHSVAHTTLRSEYVCVCDWWGAHFSNNSKNQVTIGRCRTWCGFKVSLNRVISCFFVGSAQFYCTLWKYYVMRFFTWVIGAQCGHDYAIWTKALALAPIRAAHTCYNKQWHAIFCATRNWRQMETPNELAMFSPPHFQIFKKSVRM